MMNKKNLNLVKKVIVGLMVAAMPIGMVGCGSSNDIDNKVRQEQMIALENQLVQQFEILTFRPMAKKPQKYFDIMLGEITVEPRVIQLPEMVSNVLSEATLSFNGIEERFANVIDADKASTSAFNQIYNWNVEFNNAPGNLIDMFLLSPNITQIEYLINEAMEYYVVPESFIYDVFTFDDGSTYLGVSSNELKHKVWVMVPYSKTDKIVMSPKQLALGVVNVDPNDPSNISIEKLEATPFDIMESGFRYQAMRMIWYSMDDN